MTTNSDLRLTLLKCVGDETRFRILLALKESDLCVCDIVRVLKMEQSLVSHHLQLLRKCGFVTSLREGRKVKYRLAGPHIAELLEKIDEVSNKL
jgi:DNA-binding transcriptional ArsR family regulator